MNYCQTVNWLKISHEETVSLHLTKATNEEFFFSPIACMSIILQFKKFKNFYHLVYNSGGIHTKKVNPQHVNKGSILWCLLECCLWFQENLQKPKK